jgi:hypothetical protein
LETGFSKPNAASSTPTLSTASVPVKIAMMMAGSG